MNAIDYAINEIKNIIPYDVLYAGMTYGDDPQLINLSSIEDKINQKVIRKRVLLASNVVGGIQHSVPISQMQGVLYGHMYTTYYIPPELVMNKEVVSAVSLAYMPGNGFTGGTMGYGGGGYSSALNNPNSYSPNPVTNVAGRIGAAASTSGVLLNSHLEMVARNTVAVYANYQSLGNFEILLNLENDANFGNLQPRGYHAFSMLCVLAVKAYIYIKLIRPMNSGYLSGGQDLGIFKAIVDDYASAEEDYQTYLREVWGKVMFRNDTVRTNKFLRSMIAPDL